MKIIFLHRVWPAYGGGETVTVCLANEMIKRGFKVHVAYLKDSPEGKSRPYIDNHLICHRIENVRFDEFGSDFFVDKKEAAYVSSELVKIIGLTLFITSGGPQSFWKVCMNTRRQRL